MSSSDSDPDRSVEEREDDVQRRESAAEAREAALENRLTAAHDILNAADQRDVLADGRDVAADQRDRDSDREMFLTPDTEYGEHWPERRDAAEGRGHAKDDRTASHEDRVALTEPEAEALRAEQRPGSAILFGADLTSGQS